MKSVLKVLNKNDLKSISEEYGEKRNHTYET